MTARWAAEVVAPERALEITWQPISLLFKNRPEPGSAWYPRYEFSHNLLRVMESVRTIEGNSGVGALYWELGRRIHHDKDTSFSAGEALVAAGLDSTHAAASANADWDGEISTRMNRGLALAGDDIGTPIISFDDMNGVRVGIFGPVITRVPVGKAAVQLWDGMVAVATVPGFWELKRTRTERPDFGERPSGPPGGNG